MSVRFLLPLLLGVAACARSPLPAARPAVAPATATAAARCQQVFPPQPWRATHAIVATVAPGYNVGLVGVTAASGEGLRALLLVPEGLVVFEAVHRRGGSE